MNNIKKLQAEIKDYIYERGWNMIPSGDLAKSVCIEAAELLELFQFKNSAEEEIKKDPEKLEHLQKELADVFIYLFNS